MKARMPKARWWRFLLDWLQWYGPVWLARRVPPWGIDWVETNGVQIINGEAGA
jgi:hypothetical protein